MPAKDTNTPFARVRTLGFLLIAAIALWHGYAAGQNKPEIEKFLTLWAGTLPVILAAPHGGREAIPDIAPRRGLGVAQFTVERDRNTAELTETLAVKLRERFGATPFLVVARFERKYVDANREPAAAYEAAQAKPYYDGYHRAIKDSAEAIRQKWGRGLLLDIHAQGTQAETIYRGTDNGRSVSQLERQYGRTALTGPHSVLGQLASIGYKIEPDLNGQDRETRYTGGYTTRTYGSHQGSKIDAIQLELGSSLRDKANLARTANDLAQAIEVFARKYLLNGTNNGAFAPSRPR